MKILCLSPHPDDIEVSAGGALIRLLDEGHDIHWIVFTESDADRMAEARKVIEYLTEMYHTELPVIFHKFEDTQLEKDRQKVLDILFDFGDTLEPDIVIGPHKDGHQDHETVYNEMLRAFNRTATIWCYEAGPHLDFNPNMHMRLTRDHVSTKCKLISFYESQSEKYYAQKSLVYAKARYWGSKCGSEYAEAFHVARYRI